MERRIHMIFIIIIIAVNVWLVVIANLIIYSLCATITSLKYSLIYQVFINVSPDEQIVKYLLEHSQLEVPVFCVWMLFVTPLLFTTCVQMDSYVQLMCCTILPYLWPPIIYSFLEKRALFFICETGSHIDTFFVLTPICLMREPSNIYSLCVVHVVCGTWSLFTFRAPLPINSLEIITIIFGISYYA